MTILPLASLHPVAILQRMNEAALQNNTITLTLPDGSARDYAAGITGLQVAESIGAGLAKAAVACKLGSEQRDLSRSIEASAAFSILTTKDEEGLEIMRHTLTAQVLAPALKELWPTTKLAIGPTIEHGFYYDIELDSYAISSDDLPKIEQKMREILGRKLPVTREMHAFDDAITLFESRGEHYKAELVRMAKEKDDGADGCVSLYRQGAGEDAFVDLCYGPHVPSLAHISKHFSLTKVAGAYWRGDSNNKQLQRIYGIAFATKEDLQAHLSMLEEAEKRDHRKLGREMDLFHFEDSAPGQPFWHHNGWVVYTSLMDYMRRKVHKHGYTEVNTPQMLDVSFWQYSGHWDKYRDNMFVVNEESDTPYALKPMSCPGDVQIYKAKMHSYRDLPIRMAEFGKVFRNEPAGARHGLMRVQGFTQDDAHIFCTPVQLEDEVVAMCDLIKDTYSELGLTEVRVLFSTRPETRIGSEEDWDRAENALRTVCDRIGMAWELNEGDGAFYAPKLDFVVKDAIGREWQCGTIQVDMNLPTRLDISYVGEDGEKHRPHMVHRAILGSIERFMGILIEHYGGKFPLWLAPVQAVVCSLTNAQDTQARELADKLNAAGLRIETDFSSNKINYKVRDHSNKKVPNIIVLGPKDIENGTAALRRLGTEGQKTLDTDELIAMLAEEAAPPA